MKIGARMVSVVYADVEFRREPGFPIVFGRLVWGQTGLQPFSSGVD